MARDMDRWNFPDMVTSHDHASPRGTDRSCSASGQRRNRHGNADWQSGCYTDDHRGRCGDHEAQVAGGRGGSYGHGHGWSSLKGDFDAQKQDIRGEINGMTAEGANLVMPVSGSL